MDSRYQNGKIYKIISSKTDNIYIGSTIKSLTQRLCGHYNDIKKSINMSSGEILKYDDATIVLIEDYPCECKTELLTRERFYIETLPNVINIQIPTRTKKEYRQDNKEYFIEYGKKYRQDNREHGNEYSRKYYQNNREYHKEIAKKYRQDNKESISKKRNETFNCDCGGKYTRGGKSQHFKTQKHKDYIGALENES